MQLNYALDRNDYTWSNALCWGNCFKHFEKASEENNIGHGLIGVLEILPIIGQIFSIFEKIIVEYLRAQEIAPDLTGRNITIGAPANDPVPPLSLLQPRSIADMLNRFRGLTGCGLFGEDQEQVEVALDGERVDLNQAMSPWKLHISANAENATAVIGVVFGALVRQRPYFTCVRTEELLKQHNALVHKEGKFITIYVPQANEEEFLKLASQLNESLTEATDDGRLQKNAPGAAVNHTDRPIGTSGFLWAHHDKAGGPIANQGLAIQDQPDIFSPDWGPVAWNPAQNRFLPAQ